MQNLTEKKQPSGQQGLVISYFGSSVAVEAQDGQVFQCHLRRNQKLPVVGDKVTWTLEKDNTGIILDILPRQSLLARGNKQSMKPLAANIDAIVIVMAPPPIFSEHLIDRYLIAAELLEIAPILVLNKIDLLSKDARDHLDARLKAYLDIPYPLILSTALAKEGVQDLSDFLKNKTAVLVGPSGVGKSSIIATLGDEHVKVGKVTSKGIGKHTTTATRLYHLPKGINLIDSPGVREFNLWPVNMTELLQGFKEFGPYLSGCKFRDCQHVAEPDCAVRTALQNGKLSPQRHESYQKLMKEFCTNNK